MFLQPETADNTLQTNMKGLEVSIDGRVIGTYVPPKGGTFAAMVGNIPLRYMRAHIVSGTETESWQWQLPDIQQGQTISFRMIEAKTGSGVPPQVVRARDPSEVARLRRLAAEGHTKAIKERAGRRST
jgi:hypothetical protein